MATRIPNDLLPNYPPSEVMGENQCKFFINKCRSTACNYYRFKEADLVCPGCGKARPRCGAKAVPETDACRSHTFHGVLSIYSLASARISEQAIEEVMESDSRSVDQEIAISRILLSNVVADSKLPDVEKLKAVTQYLTLLKTRKSIESGDDLEIKMDDKTAQAIRRRFKSLMAAFVGALREEGVSDEKVHSIMERVKTASKLAGRYTPAGDSSKSLPPVPGVRTPGDPT